MPSYLGEILVHLRADAAQWVSGLELATRETQKFGRDMERGFRQLSNSAGFIAGSFGVLGEKGILLAQVFSRTGQAAGAAAKEFSKVSPSLGVFAGVAGAASVAAISVVGGLVSMATHAADFVEEITRTSERTGIAVPHLLALKSAGAIVGVSIQDVATAMRKFSQQISGIHSVTTIATADLKALGITSRDPYEALLQLADAFSKMEDGSKKTALAVQLLGRGGMSLIPILNEGRAGIEAWAAKNKDLADLITNSSGKVTAWKSSVEDLNVAWEMFQVTIGSKVLPVLTKLLDLISKNPQLGIRISTENGVEIGLLYKEQEKAYSLAEGMKAAESVAARLRKADLDKVNDALLGQAALLKAGTRLQFELAQAEQSYAQAVQTNNGQEAVAQAKKITALKAQLSLVEQQEKAWERVAKAVAEMHAKPGFGAPKSPKREDRETGLVANIAKALAPPAPQRGTEIFGPPPELKPLVPTFSTNLGQAALEQFWTEHANIVHGGVDKINQLYGQEEQDFRNYVLVGEISQEDFNEVMATLEGERLRALNDFFRAQREARRAALESLPVMQRAEAGREDIFETEQLARAEIEWGTFSQKLQGIFDMMAAESKNVAGQIGDVFAQGLDKANDALARFIVTGRGGFLQVLESMSEELTRVVLHWIEFEIAAHVLLPLLNKIFGTNFKMPSGGGGGFAQSEAKSAASAEAAYAGMAAAKAAAAAAPNPAAMIAAAAITEFGIQAVVAAGSLAGKALAFAEGGSISGGQPAIVGERGPELFVPHTSGTIIPNHALGSGSRLASAEDKSVNIHHHWNVIAMDAASFKDHLDEHRDAIAAMMQETLRERNQI